MVTNYNDKWNYNNCLNRYYNGCNYLIENPEEHDKYIKILMDLKHNCEVYLARIEQKELVTENERLNGFELS